VPEPTVQETELGGATAYELPPFAEVVASLADIDDPSEDDDAVTVEEIRVGLAIELEVRDADAPSPRVTGSTPTQWTETTVLPAFHRLSMRITRERHA
jgi:hypothetical protein